MPFFPLENGLGDDGCYVLLCIAQKVVFASLLFTTTNKPLRFSAFGFYQQWGKRCTCIIRGGFSFLSLFSFGLYFKRGHS